LKVFSISEFERNGFALVKQCIDSSSVNRLRELFHNNDRSRAGIRNLLVDFTEIVSLVQSGTIRSSVVPVLGENTIAVRALYFNKTAEANWCVHWHQDKTIAVKSKEDVPGFKAWSIKNEVVHVHPPTEVMENMLALRIHLDDAGANSGGLRTYPSSHKLGVCATDRLIEIINQAEDVCPPAKTGDTLLMRPLLVHSSERCVAGQRRVIHIEFAGGELPKPLRWYQVIRIGA